MATKKQRETALRRNNLALALTPPRRDNSDTLVTEYAAPPAPASETPANVETPDATTTRSERTLIESIPLDKAAYRRRTKELITIREVDLSALFNAGRGYYPTFNDISDRLIPTLRLTPHEQALLWRMWRLSRGLQRMWCKASYAALAHACILSEDGVRVTLKSLAARGLIEPLNEKGARVTGSYLVLPFVPIRPESTRSERTLTQSTRSERTHSERATTRSERGAIATTTRSERDIKQKEFLNKNIDTAIEQAVAYYRECGGIFTTPAAIQESVTEGYPPEMATKILELLADCLPGER